ncbi:hypothetical protein GCM10027280_05850 [Micromonospora polyrhachis]|uniref:LPXTG-motif cell wall anchor domain-containing protein n=1 Tax=Micromonospora polyrhachis TaxID=1282883 RepID=A0A7W7WLU8_9ACTN|nr:hypothetical protein [Micromonospora polyrhachis]MBB4956506.1 hypothetical protein [Micromonospora polyrhachis]
MTRRRFPVRVAALALVPAPLLLFAIPAAVSARATLPAAAFGPTAATLGCRLYFNDAGTGSSPTVWQDTFTLTQSPAEPTVGDTVTVTLRAQAGPDNGPVGLNAGDVPVQVTLALGGALSSSATLRMSSYPAQAVAPAAPLGPITATGTYFASSAGAATLTVQRVTFANASATTYCSAAGDRDHKAAPAPTSIVESFTVGGTGTATPPPPSPSASTPASPSPSVSPSTTGPPAPTSTDEVDTPAEPFGPKRVELKCKTLSSIAAWSTTHTLTMSPSNPGRGAKVRVSLKFSAGPKSGPVAVGAGELVPKATVKVGGVGSGTVNLQGPAYGAIGAYTDLPGATLTGTYTTSQAGLVTLTVTNIVFDHAQVDTDCNAGADPVTGPAATSIVAKFTVKSRAATDDETRGGSLPTTGEGGMLPLLLLWSSAALLLGIGLLVVLPKRRGTPQS